jgi:hypothetical protein
MPVSGTYRRARANWTNTIVASPRGAFPLSAALPLRTALLKAKKKRGSAQKPSNALSAALTLPTKQKAFYRIEQHRKPLPALPSVLPQ